MAIWRLPVTITDPRAGTCVNVWHARTAGALGDAPTEGAQLQGAVDALRAFYFARAITYPATCNISLDFAIEETESRDKAVTFAKFAGTNTSGQAPPHLSICVNLKTAVRGRRARGRIFLGPHLTVDIDGDGSISNTALATLNTQLTTLRDASLVDNGWALGVWGLQNAAPTDYWKNGGTGKELPHVLRDVVSFQVNDRFAVMRSRKPKG